MAGKPAAALLSKAIDMNKANSNHRANFKASSNASPKHQTLSTGGHQLTSDKVLSLRVQQNEDTKYDLPLQIKNKVSTYKNILPSCPTLQA